MKMIKIEIKKLANDGEGLAYYKRQPVFIYYALPGEEVLANIKLNKRKVYEGTIKKIIKSSPKRIKPICPYFTKCGGCTLMHLDNKDILEYKLDKALFIFNNVLKDNAKKIKVSSVNSLNEIRYRNQTTLPIRTINNKNIAGLYTKRTNKVFSMDDCFLQTENLNLLINDILKVFDKHKIYSYKYQNGFIKYLSLRTNSKGNMQLAIIVSKSNFLKDNVIEDIQKLNNNLISIYEIYQQKDNINPLYGDIKLLKGEKYLKETLKHITILLTPKAFFQLNYDTAISLYDKVLEIGNFNKEDTVLDAYCGVATIGQYLANSVKEVLSIDNNKDNIIAARESVKINNIKNIKLVEGSLENMSSYLKKANFTKVIFDPPRLGLDDNTINFILNSNIKEVIYVSCEIETLARDLNKLSKKYKIVETHLFDMFPKTAHIESVTLLKLK